MSVGIVPDLLLAAGVEDFLKRHALEADFQTVCEVVRATFPDLLGIEVDLLEDPDEDDRTWVALHVNLSCSYPPDLLQIQRRHYHQELVQRLPSSRSPSFALLIQFVPE